MYILCVWILYPVTECVGQISEKYWKGGPCKGKIRFSFEK